MCGIAGFFDPKGQVSMEDLQEAAKRLAHRGPDDEGIWQQGPWGLGHRRLSILDLSPQGHQPFWSQDGRLVCVYNGEIYNYRELAAQYGLNLKTGTDTEVLVELFAKMGTDCLPLLQGMFTFAVLEPSSGRLWLVRDRLGIKPLYLYHRLGQLAFGSELQALLAFPFVRKNAYLAPEAITQYLHLGYIPEPFTHLAQVQKFPAGCYANFEKGDLSIKPYWSLEEQLRAETIHSEAEAMERLGALSQEAVRQRLAADVPLGTFLSGGTDSSLVTALAAKARSSRLKTFTIGFESQRHNETRHARRVAEHLNTEHHELLLAPEEAAKLVEDLPGCYQEPFASGSALPTMLISRWAREHITVALAGDGGDETHLGYGMYRWARRLQNSLLPLLRPALSMMGSRYQRIGELLKSASPYDLRSHIFSQEEYCFSAKEAIRLAGQSEALLNWPGPSPSTARQLDPAEQQALFDLRYYLRDNLLVKVDRASMAAGLELRVPLLDHRMVELALNISPKLRWQGSTMKALLRKLVYQHIPPEIMDRPKWGFSVPLDQWLQGLWAERLQEVLSEENLKAKGLVDPAEARKVLAAYQQGRRYYYNRVWQLFALHLWAEKQLG